MLHIDWILSFAASVACLSIDHAEEGLRALAAPVPRVIELRKRYTIYVPVYYVPDWTAVTTCGVIPYAIGQYLLVA